MVLTASKTKDGSGLGSTRGLYKFTTELQQTALEESRHMQTEFMVISKLNEGRLRDSMPIAQQTSVTTFNPNQPFNSMLSNLRDVFVPLTSMMSKIEEERKTTEEKPTRRALPGRRRGNERVWALRPRILCSNFVIRHELSCFDDEARTR